VLDLAKIEARQLSVESRPVDLRATIGRISAAFAIDAGRRGLEFSMDLGEFDAHLQTDERCVTQVLNNLLSNALKCTTQGSVGISLERVERFFVVTVADTGIGIRPEDVDKLFRRFSQVDTGMPTSREGAGLGLAIARHLVDALGGRIWVESEIAKGSRFCFTLPVN
jgi:signal transduction histidine kinase